MGQTLDRGDQQRVDHNSIEPLLRRVLPPTHDFFPVSVSSFDNRDTSDAETEGSGPVKY
jgi:hypothetical protein